MYLQFYFFTDRRLSALSGPKTGIRGYHSNLSRVHGSGCLSFRKLILNQTVKTNFKLD